MNVAVTYFSRTGNTKKVACTIADAAGCPSAPIAEFDAGKPLDLLFIGGAVYGAKLDPSLVEFIGRLDPRNVKRAVVFSTYFTQDAATGMIKELLKAREIAADDKCFACKGKFMLWSRKHPDSADLKEAAEFAASVVS
jgi:flavodoxin